MMFTCHYLDDTSTRLKLTAAISVFPFLFILVVFTTNPCRFEEAAWCHRATQTPLLMRFAYCSLPFSSTGNSLGWQWVFNGAHMRCQCRQKQFIHQNYISLILTHDATTFSPVGQPRSACCGQDSVGFGHPESRSWCWCIRRTNLDLAH